MLLAIAPSPALDRTLILDGLATGEVHRPRGVIECAGGKGLNVARAAASLGVDVTALTILGGHTGRLVRDCAAAEGTDLISVDCSVATRVCTTLLVGEPVETIDIYESARPVPPEAWSALLVHVEEQLGHGRQWMTVSGSLPSGIGQEEVAHLVALAHSAGARVALDTHGPALEAALEERPDVVKVNLHEASEALREGFGDPAECARRLHHRRAHGSLTIVTAGVRGAYAAIGEEVLHASVPDLGPFPTGSGDCFLAGLVAGLDGFDSLPTALARASAAAAANAQVPGAARLDSELVDRWTGRIRVKRLS